MVTIYPGLSMGRFREPSYPGFSCRLYDSHVFPKPAKITAISHYVCFPPPREPLSLFANIPAVWDLRLSVWILGNYKRKDFMKEKLATDANIFIKSRFHLIRSPSRLLSSHLFLCSSSHPPCSILLFFAAWYRSAVLAQGDQGRDVTRHKGDKGLSHFSVQPEWRALASGAWQEVN